MKFNAFFLGILLIGLGCREQKPPEVTLQEDVRILASDSLMGRETGKEGAEMAAAYLEGRMRDLGLKPFDSDQDYTQDFSFRPKQDPHADVEFGAATDSSLNAKNLLGLIDNGGSRTVILGAHYDHLGMGGEGSLYKGDPAVHNGADDNASGVATLLKLTRMLKEWPEAKDNYLILLFSGEEMGLLGSNFFAKNPTLDLGQVAYMINLDMVGNRVGAIAFGPKELVLFIGANKIVPDLEAAFDRVKNVAAVMVTANMPPFSRIGNRLDVVVSSIGDAQSLVGGTLLMTPMKGVDGKKGRRESAFPDIPGHSPEQQEQQHGIENMPENADQVMPAGTESENLHVGHVGKPGNRVPVFVFGAF